MRWKPRDTAYRGLKRLPCQQNLPEPFSELIGRDAELHQILEPSASHRLVTLTGAGGIGKTRLGFEAARPLLLRFTDGVWAIELAPLSDSELVAVAVATALGLDLASGTASAQSVATALGSKQLTLVEADEFDATARRHARHYLEMFIATADEAKTRPTSEWLADYAPRIDNLRVALDWPFRPAVTPRSASPSRSPRCHCGFSSR